MDADSTAHDYCHDESQRLRFSIRLQRSRLHGEMLAASAGVIYIANTDRELQLLLHVADFIIATLHWVPAMLLDMMQV